MKHLLPLVFALVSTTAMAQCDSTIVVDLHLAGYHQERAAKLKQDRAFISGTFLLFGVGELAQQNPVKGYGWALIGVAAAAHFGLEIPITRHERESARILQRLKTR